MRTTILLILLFSFSHRTIAQTTKKKLVDGIVANKITSEKQVLAYPPVRETDILWEKKIWRVLDTREKMNLPFRYPQKMFFSILREGIAAGELTAYDTEDDQFSEELSSEEIEADLVQLDTILVINPSSYDEDVQVVRNEVDPDDIKRYRIKEVWYFDTRYGKLKSRIIGIAPLKEEYDENGNFLYERPLFWLYYPNCRKYLAKHLVPNSHNDRSLMSWEDLFEMRAFASYIYKESNIHDWRIQDYKSGIDKLLEADKIGQNIFNYEHDLWSY